MEINLIDDFFIVKSEKARSQGENKHHILPFLISVIAEFIFYIFYLKSLKCGDNFLHGMFVAQW